MNKAEVRKIRRAATAAKVARDLPFGYAHNPYVEARFWINLVCDEASMMCGAGDPDAIDERRADIERSRRELLKLARVLRKENKSDA